MGRIVVGMGIGMASMCIPVYMAETSPVELRGFLGASFQVKLPLVVPDIVKIKIDFNY